MKRIFILLLVLCNGFSLFAKDTKEAVKSFEGTFPGKPIITLFTNYHAGLGNASGESGFDMKRAYLGYKFDNGGAWSGRVIFDITTAETIDNDLEFSAYLKNAYVTWEHSKLKLNFGLIKTNNFEIQQKAWGHRYIMKSFVDEYGIAPSADIGVSAEYKFNNWISTDFSVTNGKGYKQYEIDGNLRYGLGLTFKVIEGLKVRTFYDLYSKNNSSENNVNQHTISAQVGYEYSILTVGGEYNYMLNSNFKKNVNLGGFSFYSTVKVIDKLYVFARYDNFSANSKSVEDTGSAIRAGIEYKPFKFLSFSPNVYNWKPTNSSSQTFIYLNLLINF